MPRSPRVIKGDNAAQAICAPPAVRAVIGGRDRGAAAYRKSWRARSDFAAGTGGGQSSILFLLVTTGSRHAMRRPLFSGGLSRIIADFGPVMLAGSSCCSLASQTCRKAQTCRKTRIAIKTAAGMAMTVAPERRLVRGGGADHSLGLFYILRHRGWLCDGHGVRSAGWASPGSVA